MIGQVMFQGVNQVTQEASILKAHEDAKPMTDQAGMVIQGQKEADAKAEQVTRRDNPSLEHEKHDAKEKGRNEYFAQKKSNKSNAKSDGKVIMKSSPGGFDMKI